MSLSQLAAQAFAECCDPKTTVKYGVKRGFPFWNVESTMFMYVPAFHFTAVRDCHRYRYKAVDEQGVTHSFDADDCCVLLTPIWAELPEGEVHLTVTALRPDGSEGPLVGARTFFRSSPFPGDTPGAVCSYAECAVKAYRFAMTQSFVQHWLNQGTPDPSYDLNTYPAKMISALVHAMISYAKLCPDDADNAMKVAVNAADFMMKITPRGDDPLANLPPTYYLDFCPDPDKYNIKTPNWYAACAHYGTMMMTYASAAGSAYLDLEGATGDGKYLEEALKIGQYYYDTVEPNGSWYLVRSTKTGEPLTPNFISPLESVTPFIMQLYRRTGDKKWQELAERNLGYVLGTQLPTYNWEGQFEDSPLSVNYMNLTHYGPIALATYYAENFPDDDARMAQAEELMRFAEDQFVIWKRPYPWKHASNEVVNPYDTSIWPTPCALEQYGWYVPIDASAATVLSGFLALYKAGRGDLYLAKARALANMLTRVQHENGQIPTHWMGTPNAEENFWFNCMFHSCMVLESMIPYEHIEL